MQFLAAKSLCTNCLSARYAIPLAIWYPKWSISPNRNSYNISDTINKHFSYLLNNFYLNYVGTNDYYINISISVNLSPNIISTTNSIFNSQNTLKLYYLRTHNIISFDKGTQVSFPHIRKYNKRTLSFFIHYTKQWQNISMFKVYHQRSF